MTKNERLQIAEWAKDFALKQGANQVSIAISKSRNIEIGYRERKLETLKESTQNSLSLNIYVNNRYSSHSTNDLRKEALKKFIVGAVASTKYLSEDPFRSLPDPKYYPNGELPELDIIDKRYAEIESAERVKMAERIESAALDSSDKLISVTSAYNDSSDETISVTSNGFVGESAGTSFLAGVEATVRGENGGRPQDGFYARSRFINDLPAPEELGVKTVERALQKIGQKKIASGKYTMLIENRASSTLLSVFLGAMSGRALQQKSSFLDGKLNKQIASTKLTLIDDPFIKKGLASRHFDSDCLAAKRRVLIDKGILQYYFIDDYYGKKLGMNPTTRSPSNLLFVCGDRSHEKMIKDIKKGILINGFIGGNSNSTTGDFSFGIVGQLIENGSIIHAVNEMNISGNANELWNKLVEMGNDPYPYSSYQHPSMMFEDIHFSGI